MTVTVANIEFGGDGLPIIAGPCVIESRDHALSMAVALKLITADLGMSFIYKSSFDKANRTSIKSYRGPGLADGLKILADVKSEVGIPVLTDIHSPEQAAAVAEVADVIQIPAFLCRQTDLLVAAGKTGKCVNVKKGQFIAPGDVVNIVKKIEATGNRNILITERGASFGYNNLVADMRAIPVLKANGYPVVFDATHSAQKPNALNGQTGGDREIIPVLARAAVAAGCDAIFMEIHDDVDNARSDAATQWPLRRAEKLLRELMEIRKVILKGSLA